ncbi:phosphonate ABC transporter, permease protein PhnE [Aphanothece hegewaldii CCALA 016]|uniref:Phosphonate ABC transporter, permease protein PhnE n=1 Tax=Aphanothece hegewaldii CCALA 016 TaxID=2107694 RepID=A0A2T1LSP8_9CHRO|nr:phosphonate ABC transporter, permease protein PhnE [Aphanothece hegewaldii]PSF33064.1 phosphonate ABC transporter, permease protein PhnE [Aphanothece hegewaldii CCALA 016]
MLKKSQSYLPSLLLGLLLIGVYIWAWQGLKVDLNTIKDGGKYIAVFLSDFFPPNWQVLPLALEALLETIQMSIIGTTIGAFLSLPIAIISAHNLSPYGLQFLGNLIQNTLRSIPSIILALIFVSAIGLGATAGTFALGIYSIGYLAKFYQEAIESVEANSLQALEVTGASWLQIAQYGILPQILPLALGYTLYMFEYNIRAASILGVVGAGGIGFELVSYINGFERTKASTFMIVMLVVVTTIDWGSSKLRQKLADR